MNTEFKPNSNLEEALVDILHENQKKQEKYNKNITKT